MLRSLLVGPFGVNCYVLDAEEGAIIVDPGADPDAVLKALGGNPIAGVFLTHGHIDHCAALAELLGMLQERGLRPPVAIHSRDAFFLGQAGLTLNREALASAGIPPLPELNPDSLPEADIVIEEGPLPFAREWRAIHSPGHSPGSSCLYHEPCKAMPKGALISGDTLFRAGMGRVDLPGGDEAALLHSLHRLFHELPADCPVYPGHGASTVLGLEADYYKGWI